MDLQSTNDALLKECQKNYGENSKLVSNQKKIEKELTDLKMDKASFKNSKVERI